MKAAGIWRCLMALGLSLPSGAAVANDYCNLAAAKALLFTQEQRLAELKLKGDALQNGWPTRERTEAMIMEREKARAPAYKVVRTDLKSSCKHGDMLELPRSEPGLVKDMCDFGKTILQNGGSVTCVVR